MALAFNQGTTGSSSGATNPAVSTAFAAAVTAGNLIVVTTADTSGTTTSVSAVTDSGGNTYTRILTTHGTDGFQMWYAVVATGGSSFTVRVTWNTATTSFVTFAAQEFNGFVGTPTLDKSTFAPASGGTTSTTANSGATATTTSANEVVVGGSSCIAASTYSVGTGFSNLNTVSRSGGSVAQESQIVSATGAQTATFGTGINAEWICGVATFKDVGGAAGPIGKLFGTETSPSSTTLQAVNRASRY